MSDVIVPLDPMNTGRICESVMTSLSEQPKERWFELDIIDEHTSVIIKVPRHQMLIKISEKGILVESAPIREVRP